MIIFYSPDSDPMLLDSFPGMKATHDKLQKFLMTPAQDIKLPADKDRSSDPYKRLLAGLQVIKSHGPILLRLDERDWLVLSGSPTNLEKYISYFKFKQTEEGNHHHPEYVFEAGQPRPNYLSPGTLSLIIELDSEWVGEKDEC